jgi:dTDP-4-amino-4,6-dideoxygalactose transaminase
MIEYENLKKVNEPFFDELKKSFAVTLESGRYILGCNVEQFEQEFAAYCGVGHCIGVASGLDAILLSLKAFDFEPGSEVLVPSNTYIATILAVLQAGLKPVLVEPDIHTYNIDPGNIEEKISKKTVALIVVHLYGKVCDMDPIMEIVQRRDLKLIEDCAQAHGATYKGKKAGAFGHCAAFSFYPTKNLGAFGDGGAVLTDDTDSSRKIQMLRNYGSKKKYYNDAVGYNSRLDEVQAGFLSVKLKHLERINEHKRKLAQLYLEYLSDDFIKPALSEYNADVYHIFTIRHPERDRIREYLSEKEIMTEIHYPVPLQKQIALDNMFNQHDYPISDEIHATTLSLPISFFHTEDDIRGVLAALNGFITH